MVDSFSACVMLGGSLVVLGYLVNFFFNGSFVDMFQSADTAAQMLGCRPDPGVHFCPGKL